MHTSPKVVHTCFNRLCLVFLVFKAATSSSALRQQCPRQGASNGALVACSNDVLAAEVKKKPMQN